MAEQRANRRTFLKRAAAAAAGAAIGPNIVPASALGLNGRTPPSERIVMGCIGTGSQGTGNLKHFLNFDELQFVAVCDVDARHRHTAAAVIESKEGRGTVAEYGDFRELLERTDLDALSIALPDHWHSIPVIEASKKGLDMYAEKPLSLTVVEGRAMVSAVERAGIVWQTGSWQRSRPHFRKACELVRNGYLGTIKNVKVGLPTGGTIEPQPVMPVPKHLDWDMWLGPAPWAPYTEERCHWDFRWIFDYSGGQLTDWAAHHCDIANWGMGTEHTGPVAITDAKGVFPKDGLWNTAVSYYFKAHFPKGASPVAPDGFTMEVCNAHEDTGFVMGCIFEGTEGTLYVSRGDTLESDPANLVDIDIPQDAIRLYDSKDHAQNFIDCVYSRKETITPIEPAHRAITIAHLGNIAMQLGRDLEWDPWLERTTDPQANRKLKRAMRAPWRLDIA